MQSRDTVPRLITVVIDDVDSLAELISMLVALNAGRIKETTSPTLF